MLVAAAALVHALLAVFDVDWLASCVIHHSRSQLGEELVVLPTLVHATRGKPGVFVEIGAFTGLELSNTVALERCFNWTGVLIEANPHNFEKLKNCGRKATFVHSAVCDSEGTARMTTDGAMMSGEFGAMSQEYLRRWGRRNGAFANRSVDVPCKPLPAILAAAGHRRADFLSLDVEGAEDRVFRTTDPSRFGLVMAEADGTDPPKDERVKQHAIAGGMRLTEHVKVRASSIFINADVKESLYADIPPGFIGPLNGFTMFRFEPSHRRMRDEIVRALLMGGVRSSRG